MEKTEKNRKKHKLQAITLLSVLSDLYLVEVEIGSGHTVHILTHIILAIGGVVTLMSMSQSTLTDDLILKIGIFCPHNNVHKCIPLLPVW